MFKKSEKGFSLVEVAVFSVVVAVGFLGIVKLVTTTSKSNTVANNQAAATNLAYEKLEALKKLSFDQLPKTPPTAISNPYSNSNPFPPESLTVGDTKFTRFTKIEKPTSNVKEITLFVGWFDRSTTQNILWKDDQHYRDNPSIPKPKSVQIATLRQPYNLEKSSGVVTGTITYQGNNFPNATVYIEDNANWSAISNGAGVYRLTAEPGEDYTINAFGKNMETEGGLRGQINSITINQGQVTLNANITLQPTNGALQGTVTFSNLDTMTNGPAGGATIQVDTDKDTNNTINYASAIADAGGFYWINPLTTGRYTITATYDGHSSTTSGDCYSPEVIYDVIVNEGVTVPLNFNISYGGFVGIVSMSPKIRGTIQEAGSGNPLNNILVQVNDKFTRSDAGGNYIIAIEVNGGFPPPTVSIIANPSNRDQNYDVQVTQVLIDGDKTVNFTLVPLGGFITGQVKNENGNPLVDYLVMAKESGNEQGTAITQSDGRYLISYLPLFKYNSTTTTYEDITSSCKVTPVLASVDDEIIDPAPPLSERSVTLIRGVVVDVSPFQIKATGAILKGTVKDSDSQLVKNGAIILATTRNIANLSQPPNLPDPDYIYSSTVSNSNGEYILKLRKNITYNIYAWYWYKDKAEQLLLAQRIAEGNNGDADGIPDAIKVTTEKATKDIQFSKASLPVH